MERLHVPVSAEAWFREQIDILRDDIRVMSELSHKGTPHEPDGTPHSGRFEYGSGDNAYQRCHDFSSRVDMLKAKGMSEKQIADELHLSIRELRAKKSNAKLQVAAYQRSELQRRIDKGESLKKASEELDIPWSTAKRLLSAEGQRKEKITTATRDALLEELKTKPYLDISSGTAEWMGISQTKLDNAVDLLREEGYTVHNIKVTLSNGTDTEYKILTRDDVTKREVYEHKSDIRPVGSTHSFNGGEDYQHPDPPIPIARDRIEIAWTENGHGGVDKDGVIELRRGVDDISLGKANYAQVRIAVASDPKHPEKGTHYMKGVAVYADDLPDGIDIRYNTNKTKGTPEFDNPDPMGETVFKKMKKDPDMPFGTSIMPEKDLLLCNRYYEDKDGNRVQSAINVVNEEGNWSEWSKTLSSQVLSKQSTALAKKQLALAYDAREEEYKEIMGLTNPTLKKKLLMDFSEECDSAAVHLRGMALPQTASYLLLPANSLKETEIYAPKFPNGTRVALIRFPHAGPCEIPELIVNNTNPEGKRVLGNAPDAVAINHKVAGKLSGADHDGDTVLVIPNVDPKTGKRILQTKPDSEMSKSLRDVASFDPSAAYPGYSGMKVITNRHKQMEMGVATNLLSDMTMIGCTDDELAAVRKYTMVIIDAEKHKLNWAQARKDFHIDELKRKYQGVNERNQAKGAATLITRAKSPKWVPDIDRSRTQIDPETGEKILVPSGKQKPKLNKKTGEWEYVEKQIEVPKMSLYKDAYELTSGGSKENPGYRMEAVYAEHANKLKALANRSRLDYLKTPDMEYSPSAARTYADEVKSLDIKVQNARKALPLERQAQLLASTRLQLILREEPEIKEDRDKYKKLKDRSIKIARDQIGSKRPVFEITDREWEAIQHGALSKTRQQEVFRYCDSKKLRERAMPRKWTVMSVGKTQRARAMLDNGYSWAQVAEAMGVSQSTLQRALKQ